jgi:predicted ATP-dependent endonuclease of OLD family
MRINAFRIKNYRSIRSLEIDNLYPISVFFGKNNVGKSNILRALHLAFYLLKNTNIFLPDTNFYTRNIYKPIEIEVDLSVEPDLIEESKTFNSLKQEIDQIATTMIENETVFKPQQNLIDDFIEMTKAFRTPHNFSIKVICNFDEQQSFIKITISSIDENYSFDLTNFRSKYRHVLNSIEQNYEKLRLIRLEPLIREIMIVAPSLERHFRDLKDYFQNPSGDIRNYSKRLYPRPYPPSRELSYIFDKIKDQIQIIKSSERSQKILSEEKSNELNDLLRLIEKEIFETQINDLIKPFKECFSIIDGFFVRISDNFILIPNKEYFRRDPYTEKDGEHITIFDMKRFDNRLASIIDSPGIKDRALIKKFNSLFSSSYKEEIGEIEINKFRDKIIAIFNTGLTSLPIENQGLGVQDLYLFLTHMILFEIAIIAIEEPEGGLSVINQKKLKKNIESIYRGSEKQIFISSHSDEFESSTSHIVEMTKDGTQLISRAKSKKEYEKKIPEVLIKRHLEEEKKRYEFLLAEMAEREITLDILKTIDELENKEEIDIDSLANKLGYNPQKIKEIIEKHLIGVE